MELMGKLRSLSGFEKCVVGTPKNYSLFECNDDFDSLLCWPKTPAGVVAILPCFAHLNGIDYDTSKNATRSCLSNGSWDRYSDYSMCIEVSAIEQQNVVELTTTIYLVGYLISLVALCIAVYIFSRYKDLRCLRNTIHMNLMLSYIFVDFIWIFTFTLQIFLATNTVACLILLLLLHYFHLTNFFWMFVEGLYLYILVVKTFRSDTFNLPICCVIGWVFPIFFILLWGIFKGLALYREDPLTFHHFRSCPWKSHSLDWIYQFPTILMLLANVLFLITIMWVLITKLKSANSVETQQYQKAAKALLVLIPLLGVTYIIVLMGPTDGVSKDIYECLRAVLLSSQGFGVALFYCFLNAEVKNTVAHHVNAWHTHHSLRSRRKRRSSSSSSRDCSRRTQNSSIRIFQTRCVANKEESSNCV